MKRLFNLVEHCIRHCEPVLLVGETGCGKTMICQLLSLLLKQKLHILNCHQHTETSDFLGGLRPVRERESLATKFKKTAERVASLEIISKICPDKISLKIDDAATTIALIKSALSGEMFSSLLYSPHPRFLILTILLISVADFL